MQLPSEQLTQSRSANHAHNRRKRDAVSDVVDRFQEQLVSVSEANKSAGVASWNAAAIQPADKTRIKLLLRCGLRKKPVEIVRICYKHCYHFSGFLLPNRDCFVRLGFSKK